MLTWATVQAIMTVALERLAWVGLGVAIFFGWIERNNWALPHIKNFATFIIKRTPGYRKSKRDHDVDETLVRMDQSIKNLQEITKTTADIIGLEGSSYNFIEEIKKIQLQLKENHADLRIIFRDMKMSRAKQTIIENGLNIISFATDSRGFCIDVSTAYLQMTGMTVSELIGYGWKNAVVDEDKNRVSQLWNECVGEGRNFLCKVDYKNIITGEVSKTIVDARVVLDRTEIIGWEGIVTKLN